MTNDGRFNRDSHRRPVHPRQLADAYVDAVNSALESGREDLAHELAAQYLQESAIAAAR